MIALREIFYRTEPTLTMFQDTIVKAKEEGRNGAASMFDPKV